MLKTTLSSICLTITRSGISKKTHVFGLSPIAKIDQNTDEQILARFSREECGLPRRWSAEVPKDPASLRVCHPTGQLGDMGGVEEL